MAEHTPCPSGSTVSLDTLTYVPDRSLPFDRCFYLKLIQPGISNVTKYALTPINPKGENATRSHDRNVFIRSEYKRREDRKKARANTTLSLKGLKGRDFLRIYPVFNKTSKAGKTELLLRIPPLDPGREYRLTLIANDDIAFGEVTQISELILQAHSAGISSSDKHNLLKEAQLLHLRSVAGTQNRDGGRFARNRFEEYPRRLSGLIFNVSDLSSNKAKNMKLFLVPDGIPFDVSLASTNNNGIVPLTMEASTQQFYILDQVKSALGIPILFFDTSYYSVYLFRDYENSIGADLIEIGIIHFSATELRYKFELKTCCLPPNLLIELPESPLDQFFKIRQANELLKKTIISNCSTLSALTTLMTDAIKCPCEEKGIKDLTQKDNLLRTIAVLYANDSTVLYHCLLGLNSLKDPSIKPVDTNNYLTRIDNLKNSITQLDDLLGFAQKDAALQVTHTESIREMEHCIFNLRSKMIVMQQALNNINLAQIALQSMFTNGMGLQTARSVSEASTSAFELITEAKFRIVPDFGFVALFKNNTSSFQDFTPYLGFQVGFRPIDKNIPFRLIQYKTIWHRLSFMSGLTLRSLKIDNQRDDFFGDKSLITGLGIRLNNYLRATTSLVWFKAFDPNRLSTNRPLRFSPAVGLSIDIELQELFGGIAKLFK